jgi:hypothetical protein
MPASLPRPSRAGPSAALLWLILASSAAAAQSPDAWIRIGAQAIPSWTRVDPIPGRRSLDEIRVV